jgi:hypothetical protein
MTPDPDRQAVYYAESLTFEETLFSDQLHTDEFVELAVSLFNHSWWVENSIPVPSIKPTTGRDTASYARLYHPHSAADEREPALHIAPNQIDAHTLAHEAAHVAQYHIYPMALNPGIQSHGLHFRAVYLIVTSILLGYDACTSLADNFSRFIPDHSWLPYAKDLEGIGGRGIYQKWCLDRSLSAINNLKVPTSGRNNGPIAL